MASSKSYPLLVDYDGSFREIIERGNYGYINENIFEDVMGVRERYLRGDKEGTARLTIKLFPFYNIATIEIIEKLNQERYRPANFMELITFGQEYPDIKIQEEFYIVALDSNLQNSYSSNTPSLFPEICNRKSFDRALALVEDWNYPKNIKGWRARRSENDPYLFYFIGVKVD